MASHAQKLEETLDAQPFIAQLEDFATEMVSGANRQDFVVDDKAIYGDFVANNTILNAMRDNAPHLSVAVFQAMKYNYNSSIGAAHSNQEAVDETAKEYKTLLDATMTLIDISKGGLQIDHHQNWQAQQDAVQAQRDEYDANFDKAFFSGMEPKEQNRFIDRNLEGNITFAHFFDEYFQENAGNYWENRPHNIIAVDDRLEDNPAYFQYWHDVYAKHADVIRDFKETEGYEAARENYIADVNGPVFGEFAYRETRQTRPEQIDSLLNYGRNIPARAEAGETIIPELSAFVRSHADELKMLKRAIENLHEMDSKAKAQDKNAPPVQGSPALSFENERIKKGF